MPVGLWAGAESGECEGWDEPRVVSRNVSPDAFMEELCAGAGGYGRFFWTLVFHYYGWWVVVIAVPALFLDHHRCEAKLPYLAWILYAATLTAMIAIAVMLELSVVQRLGLLRPGDVVHLYEERRWRIPLVSTVLWKLDGYTDIVFVFLAHDCGSSLWWASLATFIFGIVFGQLLINTCFACTDCDRELPPSFGFVLLDFKLVNTAVRHVLPFDPDASHLPVARPVTLRTTAHLITMEKVVGDVAQVAIQSVFLYNAKVPHGFVIFSCIVGVLHGLVSLCTVVRECVQDEWAVQAHRYQNGTALLPATQLDSGTFTVLSSAAAPTTAQEPAAATEPMPELIGARSTELGQSPGNGSGSWKEMGLAAGSGGGSGGGGSGFGGAGGSRRNAGEAWDHNMPDLL